MDISTKTGDFGTTVNLNGEIISKNSPEIHLLGTLDELNSHLGLIKAKIENEKDKEFLNKIQNNIMKLMAHVSCSDDEKYFFSEKQAEELEKEGGRLMKSVPENSGFILPGKNETEAFVHIARTVARRAERYFAAVSDEKTMCPKALVYLNRLSDYLFVLSMKA